MVIHCNFFKFLNNVKVSFHLIITLFLVFFITFFYFGRASLLNVRKRSAHKIVATPNKMRFACSSVAGARSGGVRGARTYSAATRSAITFWLNGEQKVVQGAQGSTFLIDYLHKEGLTGAKLACGEGG